MTLWILGGLDPTTGAGVVRDAATLMRFDPALDRRVLVTAWTRQGEGKPATARAISGEDLRYQIEGLPSPRAVKVGLVPQARVEQICEHLGDLGVPIVLDPVLRASDGGHLGASLDGLHELARLCTVVTPNLLEARELLGNAGGDASTLARRLCNAWGVAVLVKGGHADPSDDRVVDVLVEPEPSEGRILEWIRPRREGPDPRGTGCALATAIACRLARGDTLESAVRAATAWLDDQRENLVEIDGVFLLP